MKTTPSSPRLIEGHKHGRVPRAVREQQILDIAERLFITQGFERTTIEDVRLAAGVSRPIIYTHYGSKDKLYLACVQRARLDYQQKLAAIWAGPEPVLDLIERGCALYFSLIEDNPDRWLVMFTHASVPLFGELGEELAELRLSTVALLDRLIRTRVSDADPERAEAFANAVFAVAEQLGRWWLRRPDIPRDRVVGHAVDFITHGLAQLAPDTFAAINQP